jgi:hypothetical protein
MQRDRLAMFGSFMLLGSMLRIPAMMNGDSGIVITDPGQADHSSERSDDGSSSREPPSEWSRVILRLFTDLSTAM